MLRTYNLTANNSQTDLITTKTVAAGSANYDINLTDCESISLQVIYVDTDANDDTFKLYGSENGIDFYSYPNANTITTVITAVNVSDGWMTESFNPAYLRVSFAKGSSTAGTYQILLTVKD